MRYKCRADSFVDPLFPSDQVYSARNFDTELVGAVKQDIEVREGERIERCRASGKKNIERFDVMKM